MTIREIREQLLTAECKAVAISMMLPPAHQKMFDLTLKGVLGDGDEQERWQAAYSWMIKNYDLINGIVYAAGELAEMLCEDINSVDMRLMACSESASESEANRKQSANESERCR